MARVRVSTTVDEHLLARAREARSGVGDAALIDEALAATHPYQRAYLPVNRLEDGTLYNW